MLSRHPASFRLDMILLLLLLITGVWSASYNDQTVCVGPYALCATVTCGTIPDNTTHATCSCFGPYEGLNIGNTTSCKDRTDNLLSTFSLVNPYATRSRYSSYHGQTHEARPLYAFSCEGNDTAPWAECRDAPCSTESGRVTCTCPIVAASTNLYYGAFCPGSAAEKTELCQTLRATNALPDGLDQSTIGELVVKQLGAFYGKPPQVLSCVK